MRDLLFLDLAAAHRELEPELHDAAARVIRSGWYVAGPEVERFEHEFAANCGQEAAVGVGNGLEALQLTLQALGVGPGDEVVVSAHTSIATWLAISHTGAEPVPVEPNRDTMLIDPVRVEEAIGPRTAAILPVHLYGMPAQIDTIAPIARRHGLALVEDASQGHGARLGGQPIGSLADATAYSLYPTKNLGALGDGGVVVSRDRQLIARIRELADYSQPARHHGAAQRYNSRLDELQAALLRVKLGRLEEWNDRRRMLAGQYLELLAGSAVTLPGITPDADAVWHQFVVRVRMRDAVRERLAHHGVPTLVHYPVAPHQSDAYRSRRFAPLPLTEDLARSVLSLPISPQLSAEDCAWVCEVVQETSRAMGEARLAELG